LLLRDNLGRIWIAALKWSEKSTHYEEKGTGGVVKRMEISVGQWCRAVGGTLKVAGHCANQGAFLSGSKVSRRWNMILSRPAACPLTSRPDQAPLPAPEERRQKIFTTFETPPSPCPRISTGFVTQPAKPSSTLHPESGHELHDP
jgi:hypothetical protein